MLADFKKLSLVVPQSCSGTSSVRLSVFSTFAASSVPLARALGSFEVVPDAQAEGTSFLPLTTSAASFLISSPDFVFFGEAPRELTSVL